MARFIPLPSAQLLQEIARQKGAAAAAPGQLIGQGLGAFGQILQKRKLKKEKAELKLKEITQKEEEDKRKDLKLFLENFAGKGQFGQQPGAGALPVPKGLQQFAPPGATSFTPTPTTARAGTRLIKVDKPFIDFVKKRLGTDFPIEEGEEMTASERVNLRKLAVGVKKGKVGMEGKLTDIQKENIKSVRNVRKEIIKKAELGGIVSNEALTRANELITKTNEATGSNIPLFAIAEAKTPEEKKSLLERAKLIFSKLSALTPLSTISLGAKGITKLVKPKKVKNVEELGLRG